MERMVSTTDILPDGWYISVTCGCGERLLLLRDLMQGKGSLAGAFNITCPACGTQGTYPAQHYKYEPENGDTEDAFSRTGNTGRHHFDAHQH